MPADDWVMRIGVMMPAYNEEKYISLCLESLLRQTLRPVQIVVCDGESTDNTTQTVAKILNDSDISFRVVTEPRNFLMGKWNISFAYWKASHYLSKDLDLVGCLEADTILDKNYYWVLAQRFKENPRLGIAGGAIPSVTLQRSPFPLPRSWEDKVTLGGSRVYRYSCWLDLNRRADLRYLPSWENVHDLLAVQRGWKMTRVEDAIFWVLRPPTPDRGMFKGLMDRTFGYPAWWVLYKVVKTSDMNRLVGYACMALWGEPYFPFKNIYRQAVISELRRRVKKIFVM